MERKLASIQLIDNIQPIVGADNIEVATVKGWHVVTKKGEFQPGDKAIYFEIDSFLPIKEEYEFLRKSSFKQMGEKEGFRLRTVKLRGQVSQGLLLPAGQFAKLDIDSDISEQLQVIKYDPPIPAELAGKVKGYNRFFVPKTDEERIQNLPLKYEEFRTHKYYATEKLNGYSASFYYNDGEFGVCCRNLDLLDVEGNIFWEFARKNQLAEKLKAIGNIVIQGEIIGEGIQRNPYKLKGKVVMFFNAYDIDKRQYIDFKAFQELIVFRLQLHTVPVLDENYSLPESIDELLLAADDKSQLNRLVDREGIVIRSFDRSISFKVISNKFLLKHED